MHCTNFPGGNGLSVDHNQRGARTTVHPGAMPLSPSFHIPLYPGNLDNPSFQPHQQGSAYAITQQIPPYDLFSRRVCAMTGGRIICDPGGNQYTDAYPVSPGQCDAQVRWGSTSHSTRTIHSSSRLSCSRSLDLCLAPWAASNRHVSHWMKFPSSH